MAKKFGVKVEEFGFGIPPRIWGKKFGETLYSINALPLGGFVKLLGEDEVDETGSKSLSPRDFRVKAPWQRIIIVMAGVVMNLLLAWIIFYGVIAYQNFKIIYPTPTPAVFIDFLQKDFPAEKAGIQVGEQVVSVDGKKVLQFTDARNFIKASSGKAVVLTLADIDGKNQRQVTVTPKKTDKDGYLIGVEFSPLAIKQYKTPTEKIFSGITYSYDLTRITLAGLVKLGHDVGGGNFKSASVSVSGPVGLAGMSNDILSGGIKATPFYLWFVGVISLTLAIFNVLPIPALDGGRLFFIVIEALTGKKVSENLERKVHQVGFALLLGLAFLITYSDISKLIK